MSGKPFFDTNVIIYAFREEDPRSEIAKELLVKGGVIGVQTLNEFVAVVRRKVLMTWPEVEESLAAVRSLCALPIPLTMNIHIRGLHIAATSGYGIYDSLMIAAALEANCSILLSEDLHDGQVIDSLTIRNPFRENFRLSAL